MAGKYECKINQYINLIRDLNVIFLYLRKPKNDVLCLNQSDLTP